MAMNYNTSIFRRAISLFNIRDASFFSNIMQNSMVPVVDIRENNELSLTATQTTSGSGTVATIATGKKFYVTSIQFSMVKNATCDVASGALTLTGVSNGQTMTLISIPIITLTAERESILVSLDRPMLLDAASAVSFGNQTFTAGAMVRSAVIIGYYSETLV